MNGAVIGTEVVAAVGEAGAAEVVEAAVDGKEAQMMARVENALFLR